MNSSEIKQLLSTGIVTVVFEKKNKTLRTMKCTTMSSYINEHDLTPGKGGMIYPDHQIRCVDVDLNEWRSFTIDSVISVN